MDEERATTAALPPPLVAAAAAAGGSAADRAGCRNGKSPTLPSSAAVGPWVTGAPPAAAEAGRGTLAPATGCDTCNQGQ